MGRKRRHVTIHDPNSWVFNKMAHVYDARPDYPHALIDALAGLARGPRVLDLGAGIGHIALPLAALGLDVVALEPAVAMLEVLERAAATQDLAVDVVHGKAESLPFQEASFDLVVVADAVHFLDAELAGREIARVLAPRAALAVVTSDFGDTPFMGAVRDLMHEATPRRLRSLDATIAHLASLALAPLTQTTTFDDETRVDREALERLVRSVSFIGPALNPTRYAAFRERLHALPYEPVWSRRFVLRTGRRTRQRLRASA
jgi:ubiquinone/menaquinone biosynthesis C-methylase UbiE